MGSSDLIPVVVGNFSVPRFLCSVRRGAWEGGGGGGVELAVGFGRGVGIGGGGEAKGDDGR